MKYLFYILVFFFVITSCQNIDDRGYIQEKVISEKALKTYVFNLDFIKYRTNMGRFVKNEMPFFYFYHPIYSKHIDIYDEQQNKVDFVSLDKYQVDNNRVVYVEFLNGDTISIRNKLGIVYLINSQSELLKIININMIQEQLNDTLLNVSNHIFYSNTNQGALISKFNGQNNPYNLNQYCDLLKYFMQECVNKKRLVFVENVFADSLIIHHSVGQLEKALVDSSCFANIGYKVYFANNSLIMYCNYDSNLYQVSLNSKEVERIIPIESKYPTSIITSPFKIGNNSNDCHKSMRNYSVCSDGGLIESVYYSSYTEMYYVAVRHKRKVESDKEKRYSILAYNKKFKKIGETDLMFNLPLIWDEKGVYFYGMEKNIGKKQIQLKYYEFIK